MDEHDLHGYSTQQLWEALADVRADDRAVVLATLSTRLCDAGDPEQALALAEEGLRAAEDPSPASALAGLARGRALAALDQYAEAVETFLAAAEAARRALDDDLGARACWNAAVTLEPRDTVDDLEHALSLYAAAIDLVPSLDHHRRARAGHRRALVLWRLDRNAEAIVEATEARHHAQEAKDFDLVLDIDLVVADAMADAGKVEDALEVVRRIVAVAPTVPGRDVVSDELRLAEALRVAGQPREAERVLGRCRPILMARGDVGLMATLHVELAEVCSDLDRVGEGIEHLGRAVAHAGVSGDHHALQRLSARLQTAAREAPAVCAPVVCAQPSSDTAFVAHLRQAERFRAAGEWDAAIRCLTAADELLRCGQVSREVADEHAPWCLAVMALAMLRTGRVDRARHCAEQALEWAAGAGRFDHDRARAWAHQVLAQVGRGNQPPCAAPPRRTLPR